MPAATDPPYQDTTDSYAGGGDSFGGGAPAPDPYAGDGYGGGAGGSDWEAGDGGGASQYSDPMGGNSGILLTFSSLTRRVADPLSLPLAGYQDDYRDSPDDYSQGCTSFLLFCYKNEADRSLHTDQEPYGQQPAYHEQCQEPYDNYEQPVAAALMVNTMSAASWIKVSFWRALEGVSTTSGVDASFSCSSRGMQSCGGDLHEGVSCS
jgi:hypothetical protein